ncbi:MAG: MBG domain-containing protein, partial [Methylobacter sp.]|uniref:beta strand repeat-containing protein n=1 Tax=Methylobacter sp. TaxID=2051955 RepID=UPI002730E257
GGQVLIGGDYQGKNPNVHNAKATYIGRGTTIKADAKTHGDGGKVIAWSDDTTRVYGNISAKGGSNSGNGGFIETSGHWLDTAGIRINASSPHGLGGEWLLDPYNITIVDDMTDVISITDPFIPSSNWMATSASSYLRNSAINTQLNNGTNITIYTGGATGAEVGNITVAANISKTAGSDATLHLKADNAIIINSGVDISSTSNKLNVILNADADSNSIGNIKMYGGSSINSYGGNIILGGGTCTSAGCSSAAVGYGSVLDEESDGIFLSGTSNSSLVTLNSNGGLIELKGQGFHGSNSYRGIKTSFSRLNSGTGNLTLNGTGGNGEDENYGIYLVDTELASTDGTLTLNGTGGNGANYNHGVYLNNSTLTTTSGELSITGTGQGSGSSTKGVYLYNTQLISSGNLNITANGTGSAGDLMQSDGIISNRGVDGIVTGSSDIALSGNNLTLTDVRSQHHIAINALGNVNIGLSSNSDYVDDQYFIYNLPFTFTFFGTAYSQAYISSNGLITFGTGTSAYIDTPAALAAYKAIAPAWNDWELHTSSGKNIFISRPTAADFAVQWNVERYSNSGNTAIFEAVLNSTGSISFNYGAANNSFAGDVTIGLSDGTSVITSQLMTDFTSLNNLKSTIFTPFNSSSYTETVSGSGGTLVGTTPVYTGTSGFNIYNGNSALTALSNITVSAGNTITQNGAITSSNGGDIVLMTGGNYTNNIGSSAFSVSGSGRWLIYSTNPANNTLNGLSPTFKHYGCQYATGNCTGYSIPTTGNGLLYSITPVLNVTPGTAGSLYGSSISLAGLGYTLSGYIDDDTAADANIGGTAGFSTNATTSSSVGSYNIAYNAGLSNALGYVISDNTASVAEFTITPALFSLSITADNATRVYGDANPVFTGNITAGGLANGDTLSSIGLTYTTFATSLSNVGMYAITPKITSSNYTFTGIDGQLTITPHDLNIMAIAASKTYGALDPVFTYNATGFVNGESSSVLTGALARTAGETVSASPYAINQGSLANSNYSISYTGANLTINPLASVAWVGGNGSWSTAGNWANNILPTTGNVLTATIPTGVTVTYDSLAGNTNLNSLNSLGHFQMTGGNLGISGNFSTAEYTQSGGNLSADSFNVSNAFNQSGGTLTASSIFINAINTIAQGISGNISAVNLTANSSDDVTFAGVNSITNVLDISAGGNIYSRTQGVSRMNRLSASNGWIDVENVGGFILGSTVINPGTTVANAAGNIAIKAKSPLTVNGAVSSTSGNVSLTASNGDILSINAPISAANGVTLAGGTLTGSNAASYLQYFNNAASGGNTLTNSVKEVTAVVLGTTTQLTRPLADQSGSDKDSTDEYLVSSAEKGKNAKQCTK